MRTAERVYRGMLKLLPAEWRERWGDEATESFVAQLDETSGVSTLLAWFWAIEEIVRRGMTLRLTARHSARRARALSSIQMMNDVRFAVRMYARSPWQSGVVALTIAIAVGGGATIYGIVDSLIFRELPFPEPGELVSIRQRYEATGSYGLMSWSNFEDLKNGANAIRSAGVAMGTRQPVSGAGLDPFYAEAYRVDPEFFQMMGVVPLLGRPPSLADGQPEVALSYSLWRSRFAGDESVIGRTVQMGGEDGVIVAVLPAGGGLPRTGEFWMTSNIGSYFGTTRSGGGLWAFARMRDADDATFDQLLEQSSAIAGRIISEHESEVGAEFNYQVRLLSEELASYSSSTLNLLTWAVAALFLITCINVAGVTLARFLGRGREIAVRLSVGAGRGRVIRQLFVESVLLSSVGSMIGVLLAWSATGLANGIFPSSYMAGAEIRPDWRVAAVGMLLGLVAGLTAALPPVVRLWRGPDFGDLRGRGGSQGAYRKSAGRLMLIAQYSLSLSTLIVTGLLVKTLLTLNSTDPGFDAGSLLTVETDVPAGAGFADLGSTDADAIHVARFQEGLVDAVESVPGVTRAAIAYGLPLTRRASVGSETQTSEMGEDEFPIGAIYRIVSMGYFEAMSIGLIAGRYFSETDREGSEPVVVVSESMARSIAGEPRNALDKLIRPRHTWVGGSGDSRWLRVIGVVGDTRDLQIGRDPYPVVYSINEQNQNWARFADLVVRTAIAPGTVGPQVVRAIREYDSRTPIGEVITYEAVLSSTTSPQRFRAIVLVALGLFALLMVVIGMYGVTAYGVMARRRELAIRGALGARPRGLVAQASLDGMISIGVGTAIGLALAWAGGRLVSGMLYGVGTMDPATLIVACATLGLTVGAATYLPALRAARIDPVSILRAEQ